MEFHISERPCCLCDAGHGIAMDVAMVTYFFYIYGRFTPRQSGPVRSQSRLGCHPYLRQGARAVLQRAQCRPACVLSLRSDHPEQSHELGLAGALGLTSTQAIGFAHRARRTKEMEIVPEGKNFRLLKEDELPEVADYLVQYMPESLKFHQTIQTYLNNKVWDFHFYVAKNWPEDPICLHFPGCTSTPNSHIYESVTIFCPSDRAELVDLLTDDDQLLDPTRPLYLNFTHEAIVQRFERCYEAHDQITGDVYVCDNPPDDDADELPPDVELVRLQPEHMKAVHDLYPASDIEGREIFEKLVAELPAYGIFVEGQLAAWMVQSYYGAMFSMQTKPEFRRKGYGIFLARKLTKEVAARGYKPFVVIRPENDPSRSLYAKLGFEKRYRTVRAVLRPR